MSVFKTKYRIVRDNYAGFEVQFKPWWFPFFLQCDGVNTHTHLGEAKNYLMNYKYRQNNKGEIVYVES